MYSPYVNMEMIMSCVWWCIPSLSLFYNPFFYNIVISQTYIRKPPTYIKYLAIQTPPTVPSNTRNQTIEDLKYVRLPAELKHINKQRKRN